MQTVALHPISQRPPSALTDGSLPNFKAPHELDPNDPNHARSLIPLKRTDPEIIATARCIAQEMAKAPREQMRFATFEKLAKAALPSPLDPTTWQPIVTLAAYFCALNSGEPYAFSRTLPGGLLDTSDPHYVARAGTLIRYAFVDRLGFDTATKMENLTKAHELFGEVGLKSFVQKNRVGVLEVITLGFPSETQGEDPAIRIWVPDVPRKWTGPEGALLATRATVWMLRFGEKMASRDEHGTIHFDVPRMRDVVWHEVFERHGLRSIIENDNALLRSYRECLVAAATALGKPNLFGYGADQLHPSAIRPRLRWIGESGPQEREMAATQVWKRVREQHPDAFNSEGLPIPSRIKEINDWRKVLATAGVGSTAHAFKNVRSFLESTTPELFGWARWQIKPWELDNREGKWQGPEGHTRFVSAFAYLLSQHGLGKLSLRGNRLDYDLTEADVSTWSARCHSGEIPVSLRYYLPSMGFAGGLAYAAHTSVNFGLEKLFGEESPGSLAKELQTKDHAKLLYALLRKHGGATRLVVSRLSTDEAVNLLEDEPSLRAEHDTADDLLLKPHPSPLLHAKFAILTKHDISLWTETRIDPGQDRKTQEAFFSNRSWSSTPMAVIQKYSPEQVTLKKLLDAYTLRQEPQRMLTILLNTVTDKQEMRGLLDMVRINLIDSINSRPSAGNLLKEALLLTTQSALHPGRILSDAMELGNKTNPRQPTILELLEASILFAVKVEAAR